MNKKYEEPQIGKRYLVIAGSKYSDKEDFIGYTGVAAEEYTGHVYPFYNCILKFDNPNQESLNEWHGIHVWHTGVEIILLEDQSYVR